MSKQTINIGSAPDDGTGDALRDAFDKTNDNFDELYALTAAITPVGLVGQASAVWTGTGLVFDVVYPTYWIAGVQYPSGTDQITLDAADVTNPRLDVIALDATGAIKITGTPSVDPVKPTVDSATEIEVTTVLVAANATTPEDFDDEDVYKENVEWTGSSTNGTTDFNNTSGPLAGTKCVDIGAFTDGQTISFTKSSPVDATDYSVLRLYIRLKAPLAGAAYIRIRLMNGGSSVTAGTPPLIANGEYGFSDSFTAGYQLVAIPMSDFNLTSSSFNRIRLELNGSNASGFKLDNIALQSGGAVVSELQDAIKTISTPSGTAVADQANDSISFAIADSNIEISASGKTVTFLVKFAEWWATIKAAAQTFTAALTATDFTATNQAGTGSRLVVFDSNGKAIRTVQGRYDSTTQRFEFHGIDSLDSSHTFAVFNSSGQLQFKVTNGFVVEIGNNGSSIIEIPTAISSGNAEMRVNSNQAIAHRGIDKALNTFYIWRTTTGSLAWQFIQSVEYKYDAFTKIHRQAFVRTSGTGSAYTNLVTIPLSANQAVAITVNQLVAYATDGSVSKAFGDMVGGGKRDGSNNTTAFNVTPTMKGDVTDTSWRIAADNTNEEIEIDFQNSPSGKVWDVAIDYEYTILSLPV